MLGFVPQLLYLKSVFLLVPVSWCPFPLLRELVRALFFYILSVSGTEKGSGGKKGLCPLLIAEKK